MSELFTKRLLVYLTDRAAAPQSMVRADNIRGTPKQALAAGCPPRHTLSVPPSSSKSKSTRSKRSTSSRRDDLVEIAAEVFAERGFKATTVRQIGDAAGVLSGSLYHHFESKESILDELLSSYMDQLIAAYQAVAADDTLTARQQLEQLVSAAFRSVETHRAAAVVLQNERQDLSQLPRFAYLPEREETVRRIWIDTIESAAASGDVRSDVPASTLYRFLRDAIWVSVRWFRPNGSRSIQEMTDTYISLLFDGIGAPRS